MVEVGRGRGRKSAVHVWHVAHNEMLIYVTENEHIKSDIISLYCTCKVLNMLNRFMDTTNINAI